MAGDAGDLAELRKLQFSDGLEQYHALARSVLSRVTKHHQRGNIFAEESEIFF